MQTRDTMAPLPYSYTPLPAADAASAEVTGTGGRSRRRSLCAAALVLSASLLLAVAALAGVGLRVAVVPRPTTAVGETAGVSVGMPATTSSTRSRSISRGPDAGVSEKTSGAWSGVVDDGGRLRADGGGNAFPWSNAMLQWQRTGFHFQPHKNWMNDPNGTTPPGLHATTNPYRCLLRFSFFFPPPLLMRASYKGWYHLIKLKKFI